MPSKKVGKNFQFNWVSLFLNILKVSRKCSDIWPQKVFPLCRSTFLSFVNKKLFCWRLFADSFLNCCFSFTFLATVLLLLRFNLSLMRLMRIFGVLKEILTLSSSKKLSGITIEAWKLFAKKCSNWRQNNVSQQNSVESTMHYPFVTMEIEIQTRFLQQHPFSCHPIISDRNIWRWSAAQFFLWGWCIWYWGGMFGFW